MPRALLPLLLVCLAGLSACGQTQSNLPQDRADRFAGLIPTNFGGTHGSDVELQAIAQQLCDGREYDFTPAGFQIAATAAALTMPGKADPRFAGGHGPLELVQLDEKDNFNTIGRVNYSIVSNDTAITNVTLSCSFSRPQAQNAINTPGISFAVNWRISFTLDGSARVLTADQVLYGVDFRST